LDDLNAMEVQSHLCSLSNSDTASQQTRSDTESRKAIYRLYMRDIEYVNNWDLVDSSAYKIVGAYLYDRSRAPLYDLAKSENIWERRVSIISTLYFILCFDTP